MADDVPEAGEPVPGGSRKGHFQADAELLSAGVDDGLATPGEIGTVMGADG